MNQSPLVDADTPARVALTESPGQQLRTQRQARGIEIERIASQLHLRKDVVDALEQDRYDVLPAPVYVAGYLRNYARLLDLDAAALVQAYHAVLPSSVTPNVMPAAVPEKSTSFESLAIQTVAASAPAIESTAASPSSPETTPFPKSNAAIAHQQQMVKRLLGVGVIGTVLALGWFYRADLAAYFASEDNSVALNSDTSAPSSAPAPETEAPVSDFTAPAFEPESNNAANSPAENTAAIPLPAVPPAETPAVVTPVNTVATPPVTETAATPAAETTTTPSTEPLEVAVEAVHSARIRVTGADGSKVLRVRLKEGERRVLSGTPPYQFLIGKADAIKVTVGGQPFDVMAHAKGKSARFSLDPATFSPANTAAAASDDE